MTDLAPVRTELEANAACILEIIGEDRFRQATHRGFDPQMTRRQEFNYLWTVSLGYDLNPASRPLIAQQRELEAQERELEAQERELEPQTFDVAAYEARLRAEAQRQAEDGLETL